MEREFRRLSLFWKDALMSNGHLSSSEKRLGFRDGGNKAGSSVADAQRLTERN